MKRVALSLIRLYQRYISPAKPGCCRFHPTCSAYAYGAIEEWGVIKGSYLALFRLLRCNPMFKGGLDPVPERIHKKKR